MYLFTRKATVANVANMPAAVGWAIEMCGYLKKTYDIEVKAGVVLFGGSIIHWRAEIDSLDKMSALYTKLLQDRTYAAMLDRAKDWWLPGSGVDEVVAYA